MMLAGEVAFYATLEDMASHFGDNGTMVGNHTVNLDHILDPMFHTNIDDWWVMRECVVGCWEHREMHVTCIARSK